MRKLQPRPIEIVNRADSFSECALKPSCVKITIRHSGILVQGEVANDEDGLMLIRLGYDIQFDIPSSGSGGCDAQRPPFPPGRSPGIR
jgi:hypothetical protein